MASYLAILTAYPLYLNRKLGSEDGLKLLENLSKDLDQFLKIKNMSLIELTKKVSLRYV